MKNIKKHNTHKEIVTKSIVDKYTKKYGSIYEELLTLDGYIKKNNGGYTKTYIYNEWGSIINLTPNIMDT